MSPRNFRVTFWQFFDVLSNNYGIVNLRININSKTSQDNWTFQPEITF